MKYILLAIIFSNFILEGLCSCNSTNIFQWSCYTTTEETNFQALAQKFNLNPNKLCDYNRNELKNCGTIPANFNLRIPNNTCVPKKGSYECYIVQYDTLYSLVQGNIVKVRDIQMLRDYNEDFLWGSDTLYYNMTLRIPAPYCLPNYAQNQECHKVLQGETLDSLAVQYNTTFQKLFNDNQKILGGLTQLNAGMEILVPYIVPDVTFPCQENQFYGCYTVQVNDTLFNIAVKIKSDPYKICDLNKLSNCSLIFVGQSLSYLKTSCIDNEKYVCYNRLDFYDPTPLQQVIEYSGISPQIFLTPEYSQLFQAFNSHLFSQKSCYNSSYYISCQIYGGMQIKLPFKYCIPNLNQTCYMGNNPYIWDIAQQYGLYWDLFMDPYNRIVGIQKYNQNMDIRIARPLTNYYNLVDCRDTPNSFICYKLQQGDYLDLIARNFNVDTNTLCQFNQLKNCSAIFYNRTLMIPVNYQQSSLEELKINFLTKQIKI